MAYEYYYKMKSTIDGIEYMNLKKGDRHVVQREIAKIWTNCSNFEESMRFGTQVVLTSTKRFSYSAKLILHFNG